jgi:hypothetical protein
MSFKEFLIILFMISFIKSSLKSNKSILTEQMFIFNARCYIPMLGQTRAEFEINQNSHALIKVDIDKNLKDMGLPNDTTTNPENVKFIFLDYNKEINKFGVFWSNTKDEIVLTHPARMISELVTSCSLWLKDIMKISKDFELSVSSPLEKDEARFGNNKFTYKSTEEEVTYGYIFQDEKLTALTQVRPPSAGLLANLIAFVDDSKVVSSENELTPIPEGIIYEDQ